MGHTDRCNCAACKLVLAQASCKRLREARGEQAAVESSCAWLRSPDHRTCASQVLKRGAVIAPALTCSECQ